MVGRGRPPHSCLSPLAPSQGPHDHRRHPAGRPDSVDARSQTRGGGSTLWRYLVIRFVLIFPTIFILVTMVFVLMRITGDPITIALGGKLPPDQLAERIHQAGYDRPIVVQYVEYLGQIFTGNFGTSITDGQPIAQILLTHGGATLELTFYALIVAFLIGIPLGQVAAYFRDRWPDAVLRIFAILAYATPVFFAGLLLKLVFAVQLDILPVAGRASTRTEIYFSSMPDAPGST